MRNILKGCLLVALSLSLSAPGAALAQLVPLSGVSDGELVRRINGIFKELSSSPVGQAGQLVPSLLESLASLDQNNMYQVYQQLHVIMADQSVVEALIQALRGSRAETASGILANCRNYGNSLEFTMAQTQEIINALASPSQTVRRNLAQLLSNVSLPADTSVQSALINLMATDSQSSVRAAAANALGNIGREVYFKNAAPIAQAFAKTLTEDVSPQVRAAAASGLSQMGAKAQPAAEALKKALADNSSQVRYQVLQSIINIGPPCSACVDELIDMFNGPPDLYRSVSKDRIAQALGAIGPAAGRSVPLIAGLLKERSTAASAARALQGFGPAAAPAVPALVRLLESPFASDRDAAARALAAIGPTAKAALSALRKASSDDRNAEGSGSPTYVKQAVQEAIFKIENAPAS
jgi:HEAT repeat protein